MPFAVLFIIFVVVVLVARANRGPGALGSGGLLARGLILQANSYATETRYLGQRYEVRQLTLDIEIPGRAPYEVTLSPRIPRIVEALPGATLDLRVSRSNPNNIEIIGPAGSSDWLRAASAVPGQTWGGPQLALGGAGMPRGCGTVVTVLIGMSLLLASILSFVAQAHRSAEPSTTPTHTPPPQPTHAPGRSGRSHPH